MWLLISLEFSCVISLLSISFRQTIKFFFGAHTRNRTDEEDEYEEGRMQKFCLSNCESEKEKSNFYTMKQSKHIIKNNNNKNAFSLSKWNPDWNKHDFIQ